MAGSAAKGGSSQKDDGDPGPGGAKNGQRKYRSPAVDRALEILEFMSTHPRPYGATELSRRLDIPKNTVFRILCSLAEKEYAAQDPLTGKFTLSTRVFTLGMSLYTRFELRQRARSHLEWLCRETEATCQIHVPHGKKVLVLDTISPEVQFYLRVVPGGLQLYHADAFGKVILAFMSKEAVREILPARMQQLTKNTITSRSELMKKLEVTQRTGLAYDNEEYTSGIYCIGAPVFDAEAKIVAGVGITALLSWFDRRRTSVFEQNVLECARRISKDIGYTGGFFSDKIRKK
jgi:IclR family transcriptional regulator, KDG regulon repressor